VILPLSLPPSFAPSLSRAVRAAMSVGARRAGRASAALRLGCSCQLRSLRLSVQSVPPPAECLCARGARRTRAPEGRAAQLRSSEPEQARGSIAGATACAETSRRPAPALAPRPRGECRRRARRGAGLHYGTEAGDGDEATATACGQHAGAIGRRGCLWRSLSRPRCAARGDGRLGGPGSECCAG